jgi:hypothetical protein
VLLIRWVICLFWACLSGSTDGGDVGVPCASAGVYPRSGECEFELVYQDDDEKEWWVGACWRRERLTCV